MSRHGFKLNIKYVLNLSYTMPVRDDKDVYVFDTDSTVYVYEDVADQDLPTFEEWVCMVWNGLEGYTVRREGRDVYVE